MTDANYQPPVARIDELTPIDSAPYYIVASFKFVLLYISTFGIYGIYWFYRHWKQLQRVRGAKVWPVPRGIFNIFFTHSLFAEIDRDLQRAGERYVWTANTQATFYVVAWLVNYVINRSSDESLWSLLLGVVFTILPLFPLLKAQRVANLALGDAQGQRNRELTWANLLWIALGVLLWLLVIVVFALTVFNPALLQE